MRWAQVIDGTVRNRILWDGQGEPPLPNLITESDAAGLPDYVPSPVVPVQVYGHQMRAVLRSRSFGEGTLWDAVLALVAGLTEPQRTTVDDSLRTAAVMRRDSPSIAAFSAALSLDAAYVDALFVEADGVRV